MCYNGSTSKQDTGLHQTVQSVYSVCLKRIRNLGRFGWGIQFDEKVKRGRTVFYDLIGCTSDVSCKKVKFAKYDINIDIRGYIPYNKRGEEDF